MDWGRILEFLGLRVESTSKLQGIHSWDSLKIFPLYGEFDSGYTLDEYREQSDPKSKRTLVGQLAYRFKYKYDKVSGLKLMDLAERFVRENEDLNSADLIFTVPPSFTSRPFDPVSFFAERISERIGIPYQNGMIRRVRLTGLQKDALGKRSKMENVRGVFKLTDKNMIKDKKVLLMDDIYASGATLNEITRMLKERGVKKILALTLIKTT
jgi:predicted amidophosphoribosyltransferase